MKITITQLFLAIIFIIPTGCGINKNYRLETLEIEEGINLRQNPFQAIQKAIELSKNADIIQEQIANQDIVEPISFKELIEYLPQLPQGWAAGELKGKTNSLGNYGISQISQTYTQREKEITVSIFDWAFNSALYAPFLLTTEFSQESTEGYNKGVKIGDILGRQQYTYDSKKGSLNLLVNNRFFVRINGKNIEEIELREWWQLIDSQSLTKISS